MASDQKKPILVAGADNPASADEIKHDSERGAEAQEANEALEEAVADGDSTNPIPGTRQSGIHGSAD